jgi:hypothetical protein
MRGSRHRHQGRLSLLIHLQVLLRDDPPDVYRIRNLQHQVPQLQRGERDRPTQTLSRQSASSLSMVCKLTLVESFTDLPTKITQSIRQSCAHSCEKRKSSTTWRRMERKRYKNGVVGVFILFWYAQTKSVLRFSDEATDGHSNACHGWNPSDKGNTPA